MLDHEAEPTRPQLDARPRRPLVGPDRPGEDVDHAEIALDRGHRRRVDLRHRDGGAEIGRRRQHDPVLTERRARRPRRSAGTSPTARRRGPRRPGGPARRTAGTRPGGAPPPSCRCPARPWTTVTPARGRRITTSCSAWIVATTSCMRPVRGASSAASSAPSPTRWSPASPAAPTSNTSSSSPTSSPCAPTEVASPHDAHRVVGQRPVERLGGRRPPVDDERVAVLVRDGQATRRRGSCRRRGRGDRRADGPSRCRARPAGGRRGRWRCRARTAPAHSWSR